MTDPAWLRRAMVEELSSNEELDPSWREAFLAVSRHVFIPDLVWCQQDGALVPLQRAEEPDRWLRLAYAPRQYVITQVDDGNPVGPGPRGQRISSSGISSSGISSSASQPDVVAMMLTALEIEPGMTVCEIGTGTGYNAALLAYRLGADHVVTIEVDSALADRARGALGRAGAADVTVVTGDGAAGYPPRAPYDRVLSTAAVTHMPYAWVAQTRPGGRMITPWGTAFFNGALLSLTVTGDGTATGSLVGNVAFMWLRAQRVPSTRVCDFVHDEDKALVSHTRLHPDRLTGNHHTALAIGLRVPSCEYRRCYAADDSGESTLWLLDHSSCSWVSLDYVPGAEVFEVNQLGPRRLWDEVEAAYRWWVRAGRPTADRWRFIVTPDGQHADLASDRDGTDAPRWLGLPL